MHRRHATDPDDVAEKVAAAHEPPDIRGRRRRSVVGP